MTLRRLAHWALWGVLGGGIAGGAPPSLAGQEHVHDHAAEAVPVVTEAAVDTTYVLGDGVVRTVGPGEAYLTVSDAIAAADAGDTIHIRAGHYTEHPVVTLPLSLIGEPGAVLDGEGEGVVLMIRAPDVTVRGLTIRGSGDDLSQEHAGLMAERARGLVVEDNVFEEVLFGAYLKESRGAVLRRNEITGRDVDIPQRGDGIRLWYSSDGIVEDNELSRVRDLVIWFSDSMSVRRNVVRGSRYGLHYMYSDHNLFEGNTFADNQVGAFIMYSSDLVLKNNVFRTSNGVLGKGLGLKDSDDITATGNVFAENGVAVYLDNSPTTQGSTNHFDGNWVMRNDVGVALLPSVSGNVFTGNVFRENGREVSVTGGGSALANAWDGNHWGRYAGFDADGDGTGDTPHRITRLADHLEATNPELAVFALSPARMALDVLARVLPFLEPQPIVIDSLPVRAPESALPSTQSPVRPWRPTFVLLGLLSLAVALTVYGRRFPD